MCLYCMIGDHQFKFDPPWRDPFHPHQPIHPLIPAPLNPLPTPPWGIDRLLEFEELLKRVKELEDKLGCPCEPNKADYLAILRARIEALEKRAGDAAL